MRKVILFPERACCSSPLFTCTTYLCLFETFRCCWPSNKMGFEKHSPPLSASSCIALQLSFSFGFGCVPQVNPAVPADTGIRSIYPRQGTCVHEHCGLISLLCRRTGAVWGSSCWRTIARHFAQEVRTPQRSHPLVVCGY